MANKQPNPQDTWGASEPAKQEWEEDNGDAARKATEERNRKQEKDRDNA